MSLPRMRRGTVAALLLPFTGAITIACANAPGRHASGARAPTAESARPGALPVDDDVVRARVAVSDLLRAMNARDVPELEARYAIRPRTKELTALARLLDRATGPSELRAHLIADPTVSGEAAHPLIQFQVEFRWTTAAGQARTQRVAMRATSLREGGFFLLSSVLPPTDFSW